MARRASQFEEQEQDPEFQISTMCDVLMCLLIFFVATANMEIMQQVAEVSLPKAVDALDPQKSPGETIINVYNLLGNNTIQIGDAKYEEPEDIKAQLIQSMDIANDLGVDVATYRVLVRASGDVPYRMVRDIMKVCGSVGIINVTFSTQENK
ncbi:MAG: biopolymer transporter ExbD [Verrucomicrobiota bacterium]